MKISLRGLIIGNLFCLLTHLIFGIYRESPSGDGYLHGGITIQFIGDRLPYSRFELIILIYWFLYNWFSIVLLVSLMILKYYK